MAADRSNAGVNRDKAQHAERTTRRLVHGLAETRSVADQAILDAAAAQATADGNLSEVNWGDIGGLLEDQTDLQAALEAIEAGGEAEMESGTIEGRISEGTGAPENLTAAQVLQILFGATPTTGAILYYNGSGWVELAPGSDGALLTVASGVPSWLAPGGDGAVLVMQGGSPTWVGP
jgi:hypothetical protein